MVRITASLLKRNGKLIVSDGRRAVIQWCDRSRMGRNYHYLVAIYGDKYIKPYRLKPNEIDYWIDSITGINQWNGGK